MAFTSYHGPDFSFESIPADRGPLPEILTGWYRKATAAGRVPCVYLTAAWCPPSVLLEKALGDPKMQHALREVDAATFNIDDWADKLTAAGFVAHSVPIFFILDEHGKPVGRPITGAAWGENTADNMAPPLARFFDEARASRPAPPPPPPAAAKSKLPGILLLVVALALLILGAWLKVASDQQDSKEEFEREQSERIQRDVHDSIQRSLQDAKK
jgi:hypothetical protein